MQRTHAKTEIHTNTQTHTHTHKLTQTLNIEVATNEMKNGCAN